jgi:hypothetical protein
MNSGNKLKSQSPQEIIANRKLENRPSGSGIKVFPAGLGVHCTLMRFFEYSYGGTSGSEQNSIANIVLPLPSQIQDSFKVNILGDELGIIGDAAAQAASSPESVDKIAKELGKATVDAMTDLGSAIKNGNFQGAIGLGADVGQFLVRAGIGKIAPDIANGISAGRGTAINPFATLVFKGVDLKSHTLEWLLSPESEEESRTLKDIIRTIQRMVLPKVKSALGQSTGINAIDRGIMKYPAMVDIYFQGIDMNYYFKFKTSMISQFNVDYTPNGLAINKGGRPSAIRITMSLQEAYIHTADDYGAIDLFTEQIAEKANEEEIARTARSANNASSDRDPSFFGSTTFGQAGGTPDGVVTAPDGVSPDQPASTSLFSDEYRVGTQLYSLNQLIARGVDRATILANPLVYVPSQINPV